MLNSLTLLTPQSYRTQKSLLRQSLENGQVGGFMYRTLPLDGPAGIEQDQSPISITGKMLPVNDSDCPAPVPAAAREVCLA